MNSIDLQEATELLRVHYGIEGTLTAIDGELDLNFQVVDHNGRGFILKVAAANTKPGYMDFQQKLLASLNGQNAPEVIKDLKGEAMVTFTDKEGDSRFLRLLTWIPGRVWSSVNPYTENLRFTLGVACGEMIHRLQCFDHPFAHREFEWDLAAGLWVENQLHLFGSHQQALLKRHILSFKGFQPGYQKLRKSIVHNDANDNNIIVSDDKLYPTVQSLIDYGDAIYTQVINDVAITCAYAAFNVLDPVEATLPILAGYHNSFPLLESELKFLYTLIAMRLCVSIIKAEINKIKDPKNVYLTVSQEPAWRLLKQWSTIGEEFAHYRFREACGFPPHPGEYQFIDWATKQTLTFKSLFPTLGKEAVHPLDLSVSSSWVGREEEFNDIDLFQFKINQMQKEHPDRIIAGGYLEARSLYTSEAFGKLGDEGREQRCIHLGVDFWVAAGTDIYTMFDSIVAMVVNDQEKKGYGGMIILKHNLPEDASFSFYTLYGHLSPQSIAHIQVGNRISEGSYIACVGDQSENGNWASHLHFQIMLSLLDFGDDFPGVAYQKQIKTWQSVCPDPNVLFKSADLLSTSKSRSTPAMILSDRQAHLGKGMSLQYKIPLHLVRGEGAYLVDADGRYYLDMINNVAHVGHEYWPVVRAGQLQMGQLNTNSRYLHENITNLAKRLVATLPPELSVVHFVNSGSEANELAVRMMKTVTGSNQIIASHMGYHGNTNNNIDISSYKFDGKGGTGKPENTYIFPIPDAFRGKYRGGKTGPAYAREVENLINEIQQQKKQVGGIIIEPIISCGGQIELPEGFLKLAFDAVHKAGGLCVVDEVQTGCGRIGTHFWGFSAHDVVPDIVTIGKPLGNGHPVAAVVCTARVADLFNNGMEFFNTFGGNPVSCAIADKVLQVISDEKLQKNALEIGNYLKSGLKELAIKHPLIGSVRGQGLFLGAEFVDKQLNPLADKADYVINRMKAFGILLSTDGPDHNVIKIKPPLVFSKQNAEDFLHYLSITLKEDFMRS